MEDNKVKLLDAYLQDGEEMGSWSSQDIVDNLRETVTLTVDEVTTYMLDRGYRPVREDGRLVWKK